MKKLILTILTTITILGVNAQGNNLQFNRALFDDLGSLFHTVSGSSPNNYTISFTVPTGKVWKITKFNALSSYDDATRIRISKSSSYSSAMLAPKNTGDPLIWLPSGTYDVTIMENYSSSSWTTNVMVTGIEFNIVP